jgi:ketosteroid isomerase-like protein
MSQENVKTVCRLFDAVNRRDFDAASELLHEEVIWQPMISVEDDVQVGKEAVREAWERNVEAMGIRPQLDECIAVGDDRVVVRARFLALGNTSGLPLEAPAGQIYAVKDGRVVSLETYRSLEEALEAAGLRE